MRSINFCDLESENRRESSISVFNTSVLLTALLLLLIRPTTDMLALFFDGAIDDVINRRKILFVSVLSAGFLPCALIANRIHSSVEENSKLDTGIAVSAVVLVLTATNYVSPLPDAPELWAGFGSKPAITTLLCASFLVLIVRTRSHLKLWSKFRYIAYFIQMALLAAYVPLFIQPPNGLINLGDTTYHVLDEILSPIVGGYPYGDYTPQYSAMIGWLVFPLKFIQISGATTMVVVIVACNLLTISIPLLVTITLRSLFPKTPRLTTLLAFVAIWTVCGPGLGMTVQLREFSHFARYFPALVLLLFVARLLISSGNVTSKNKTVLTGLVMSFAILNSPDVGLGLAIAVNIALFYAVRKKVFPRESFQLMVASSLAGIAFYFLLLFAIGQHPSFNSVIGLRRNASILYSDIGIQVFGPHLIVIGIATAAIAIGSKIVDLEQLSSRGIAQRIVALIIGLWLLFLLPKFFLFPHPVGVPGLFIPAFLAGATIVNICAPTMAQGRRTTTLLKSSPIFCLMALPIGALWQHSSPIDEFRRISKDNTEIINWSSQSGRTADGWSPEGLAKYDNLLEEIQRIRVLYDSKGIAIGYFGLFGNTVELLTGVNNYLGIPAPESLRFGVNQEELACGPIDRYEPDFVLVYGSSFPCQGYSLVEKFNGSLFRIYSRS